MARPRDQFRGAVGKHSRARYTGHNHKKEHAIKHHSERCVGLSTTYDEGEQVAQAKAADETNHALLVRQGWAHGTHFL